MAKLQLHQGFYEARSPIANAQVCYNCYGEQNPPDAPFPVTIYPSPGLSIAFDFTGIFPGWCRGLYVASDGSAYAVLGNALVRLMPGDTPNYILQGDLPTTPNNNPVVMVDNGTTLVAVDGSGWGGQVALASTGTSGNLQQITDPAFYGANRVDFIDTFMIFNQPGTSNFYTTTSNVVTPFDPTYFAAKEGYNDRLVSIAALHDNIWLFGDTTTEIWFNAGGSAFPFARMPNSVLQQGCVAPYSVVVADNAVYWVSQDRWGRNMCMRGEGYSARRISTFAVEDEWSRYSWAGDAIGMSFQLGGHEYICIRFPTGNAFWVYDASTQLWHQRTYGDLVTPWPVFCATFWGNVPYAIPGNLIMAGDVTAPRIFAIDRLNYTDIGVPITRQRSWMHLQQDGQRIAYTRFAMSMTGAAMSPDTVSLDWSDDAGQTFGTPVPQTTNNQTNGQYLWRRLGYGRDRVYRATWSGQGEFALNGAYSDGIPEAT